MFIVQAWNSFLLPLELWHNKLEWLALASIFSVMWLEMNKYINSLGVMFLGSPVNITLVLKAFNSKTL
jgi:hypothetical protein